MNIKKIIEDNPKGFSIYVKDWSLIGPGNKKTGYIVSLTNNKIDSHATEKQIDTHVRQLVALGHKLNVNENRLIIGGWTDDKGQLYIDLNLLVFNVSEAQILGKIYGQFAYYDIDKGQSIEVIQN